VVGRAFANPGFRRIVIVMVVAIVLVFRVSQFIAGAGLSPTLGYDFGFYWKAAWQLLDGQSIYSATQLTTQYAPQGQDGFLYPPPFAVFVIPFAALSSTSSSPGYWAWIALGLVIAGATIHAIWRAERLGARFEVLRGAGWLLLVAAFLALPPVLTELINGNVHLLLFGLLGVGWLGVRRGDARGDAIGGAAVGLATLVKVFPGVVILWFALTRRWRAVGWALVAALVASLVTLPVVGIQAWLDYPAVLLHMDAPIDPTWSVAPTTWLSSALGFQLARAVVTVVGLGLVVAAARRVDARSGYAIAVLVGLLITPILWSHYLAIVALPLLLALAGDVPLWVLGASYVLLSGGNQTALADAGAVLLRLLPLLGMLLLLGGFVVGGWKSRTAASSGPAKQTEPAAT
jgi:hypothetical protein